MGVDSNAHMIRFADALAGQAEAAGGTRPSLHCMDATELGRKAELQDVSSMAALTYTLCMVKEDCLSRQVVLTGV